MSAWRSPPAERRCRGVTIEGRIAPGDFVKFAALVLATPGANVVWLASPGGNMSEALRIGRLIRQLAMEVRAPADRAQPLVHLQDSDNNTCASACFFLYVAGVNRQGSVLGIHKPALPADEYFAVGLDGAVAAHQRIEEATVAYLDLMGAPARYARLMLTTSSGEMLWLSPDDIARDFDRHRSRVRRTAQSRLPGRAGLHGAETRRTARGSTAAHPTAPARERIAACSPARFYLIGEKSVGFK